MQRTARLILALLLATLAACSDPPKAKVICPDDAHRFWTTFRSAVLKDDVNAVADMTEFPLTVIWLREDREQLLSRQEFIKYYPKLLNASLSKLNPPMTPTPASMKALVRIVTTPRGPVCSELPGQFNVGNWTLGLTSEGWRLGVVYVHESTPSMNIPPLQP